MIWIGVGIGLLVGVFVGFYLGALACDWSSARLRAKADVDTCATGHSWCCHYYWHTDHGNVPHTRVYYWCSRCGLCGTHWQHPYGLMVWCPPSGELNPHVNHRLHGHFVARRATLEELKL